MNVSLQGLVERSREALFVSNTHTEESSCILSGDNDLRKQRYSYIAFGLFALLYFWYYIPQGFTLLDDAYLPALGQRIANGEKLYADFYYLRTPLSPYLQSLWIQLLGDNYTVLYSRIIWALQLFSTIVIFSLIYRRWFSALPLLLILCSTLVYSSLLFGFAWYTYDGMFFTALFVYFAYHKRFLFAGICAGLAFLCKQGFVALLPLMFLFDFLEVKLIPRGIAGWLKRSALSLVGAVGVIALSSLMLSAQLPEIWDNIFVLPRRVSDLPLSFLLYQDLPETLSNIWPYAIFLLLVIIPPLKSVWKILTLFIGLVIAWEAILGFADILPRMITLVSFAVIGGHYLIQVWTHRETNNDSQSFRLTKISSLALMVLFVAGFNYNGWLFSYIGGVISLPILILWSSARISKREYCFNNWLASALAGVALIASLAVHHQHPYKSSPRDELTFEFTSDPLKGIFADSTSVHNIDKLISMVQGMSGPQDSILAFPDPSSLSFLTKRHAWGRIQWYFELEFDSAMAEESVNLLIESPPKALVLRKPERIPNSPRFNLLLEAIYDKFSTVDSVGSFHILVPMRSEESMHIDE